MILAVMIPITVRMILITTSNTRLADTSLTTLPTSNVYTVVLSSCDRIQLAYIIEQKSMHYYKSIQVRVIIAKPISLNRRYVDSFIHSKPKSCRIN